MKRYKFKAKELNTNKYVYGDLVYAQRTFETEGVKPMLVHVRIHGGMTWITHRTFIDESTLVPTEEDVMTKEDKLAWIKGIVAECGNIHLSDCCGRYYALVYDDANDAVTVLAYIPHGDTETLSLYSLSENEINTIYEDLLKDFGEE